MSVIRLLDKSVADLIAAGEVVERPASVVKELVENAIDAKASQITVEILRGGISFIKVSDNGIGMSETDAKKAFLKHATSKIYSPDDLNSIHTLGFRGEALCSIAAVSTVTLKTKNEESDCGYTVKMKAGNILLEEPTAYPRGTEILVENLFENTPARFKFLKSESAETTIITTLIENLSLSHPEIAFQLTVNGKERLRTYGNGNLKEAVYSVFGRDFSDSVIEIPASPDSFSHHGISVSGFIGKPLFTKGNRTKQLFYVNNRYIKSVALSRALENAYRNNILSGRFPVCVLFLELSPADVDVNVHPGKTEVKFADEVSVYDAVASAVSSALDGDKISNEFVPKSSFSVAPEKQEEIFVKPSVVSALIKEAPTKEVVFPVSSRKEAVDKILSSYPSEEKNAETVSVVDYGDWRIETSIPESGSPSVLQPVFSDIAPQVDSHCGDAQKVFIPERKKVNTEPVQQVPGEEIPLLDDALSFRILGEVFHTYIIVEKDEELIFIDKHALHERMNFERMKTKETASKMLLTPMICSLGGDQYASVLNRLSLLNELGFSVEDFGDGSVIIREIPELLGTEDVEPFLENFAGTATVDKNLAKSELLDRFLYDIACKASIKAGKISSGEELETLVRDYFKREQTLRYCPHGRPVLFTMSRKNIEKQFKRIL